MAGLRFADIQDKPIDILNLTSLTLEEFKTVMEPFETLFQVHMAKWRIDGKPRIIRSYVTYKNCPLPTPEDRLLFVLIYLKNNPLQVLHGRLFGMAQCKANTWLHVLLPVLRETMVSLGDVPCRSLVELAKKLEVPVEEVETMLIASQQENPDIESTQAVTPPTGGPLFVMMEPKDASSVPKIRLNRKSSIAARKGVTR